MHVIVLECKLVMFQNANIAIVLEHKRITFSHVHPSVWESHLLIP